MSMKFVKLPLCIRCFFYITNGASDVRKKIIYYDNDDRKESHIVRESQVNLKLKIIIIRDIFALKASPENDVKWQTKADRTNKADDPQRQTDLISNTSTRRAGSWVTCRDSRDLTTVHTTKLSSFVASVSEVWTGHEKPKSKMTATYVNLIFPW